MQNGVCKESLYKSEETYRERDLAYLLVPHDSSLKIGATKFWENFKGPFVIDMVLDSTHLKLRDLETGY